MKIFSSLTVSSLIILSSVILLPATTFAQSTSGGFGNSGDNRDPFNRASSGDTAGLMQLLNQVQLSGARNTPEYAQEQQEQLNSATTEFRARQEEALRAQAKKTSQPGVSNK